MEINAGKIRLQIDNLEIYYDRGDGCVGKTGWSLARDMVFVVSFVSWEQVWDTMTTMERTRCISFASQMK
jgi:hypothetical protein